MRISPVLLAHPAYGMPTFEGTLILRAPDLKNSECEVTWLEAFALAVRGEIEAIATSAGRIKCFRRLAPEERPEMPVAAEKVVKGSCGGLGAALQTVYEEQINGTLVLTLMKARGRGFARWSDSDGFNPYRFNPDSLNPAVAAGPLTPPMNS